MKAACKWFDFDVDPSYEEHVCEFMNLIGAERIIGVTNVSYKIVSVWYWKETK